MVFDIMRRYGLQLFAEGGEGGNGGEGAAASGENAPAAGEARLRELGVPESVLQKRASRRAKMAPAAQQAEPEPQPQEQQAAAAEEQTPEESNTEEKQPEQEAPARMTWDQIMADPEYNQQMQQTIQARLRTAKAAEDQLSKLSPAIELLARKYGLDAKNLDADALTQAISNDDQYYEDRALEMGVPVATAKMIDQAERDNQRRQEEQAAQQQQQMFQEHIRNLQAQGEVLKQTFKNFDLNAELRNPAFARMTSPQVGLSVEDAYYAVHRREIQQASMQVTAQKTAEQMANAIRSGQNRPVENGTSVQAPSVTSFDYAHASREQREALKRSIREAAAQGRKIYPGQR